MPYITGADVALYLGINLDVSKLRVLNELIIPAVSSYVDRFTNRTWDVEAATAITETFDGGPDTFFVNAPPINSVTSVSVDGTAIDSSYISNGKQYVAIDYKTTEGIRNVSIVYTSSASLPSDLKMALIQWAGEMFKAKDEAGREVSRMTVGSITLEYAGNTNGVPSYVMECLRRYRLKPVRL